MRRRAATFARRPGRPNPVALVLLLLLLAGACRQSGRAEWALAGAEAVTFRTSDGVELDGRLFGDGAGGVVLVHGLDGDQSDWFETAGELADRGHLVLTFDLRGYCPGGEAGCSGGTRDVPQTWRDVTAAFDLLRERGARRVVIVGADIGGTAALVAAGRLAEDRPVIEGQPLTGVVTLSAPATYQGLAATPDLLFKVYAPKLVLAGTGDGPAARDAQAFYTASRSPKRVEILPTDAHGVALLTEGRAEEARQLVFAFIEENL
ncbi:MAG: alpha/beta fold hydrolase [Actinobacteria bacterium]|nr:alpha/beta fold hydrolase [Actinomycetota bacterium]